jgi:peptidyl-prolyl cis-trans isomerase SurA
MMKAATLCGGKMDSTAIAALAQNELVLATFGDKQYTTKDAAASINPRRLSPATTPMQAISNDVERAVEMGLMNIEISTLEVKYPEYSNLINEYRDGMLLFEISNREVWEKASTDVKGLEKFFNKNKKNYKWDRPRYKGFVVYGANEEMVKDVKKLIKKTDVNQVVPTVQAAFNNDSVTNVVVERGLYLSGDNKYVDELAFEGAKAERDADLPVVFLSGKVLKAPETYLDVRGQVTADYQEYLEKQWVNKLNKNAKVVINQDVLKTVK